MTDSMNQMDMGGITLTLKDLELGVSSPGKVGTGISLSSAELGVLDSASNANSTTGKVAILGTSGAVTFAGAVTPTGGVVAANGYVASPRNCHTGGNPPQAATDFSDYTVVATETIRAEVFVPCNVSSTGVAVFNGSAVAGNIQAFLIDSLTGAQVAATASTAQSGTDAYQRIAWVSGPIALKGPATYFVCVQGNTGGGTSKLNAHTVGNFGADKQTGTTYGTLTVAAGPTTFTTALGPVASLY